MASLKKRGKTYYAQYYVNGKQKRVNLETNSLQVANDRLRKIEDAVYRGDDLPLPTKTPIGDILETYMSNLRGRTRKNNVQKVASYFRGMFGQVCDSLKLKNQAIADKAKKRPASGSDPRIEISNLEQLTAQQVSRFLSDAVQLKGVAPRTVNHYRQNLVTLCNWAMREGGVRFPKDKNPVESVKCYKVPKHSITFLRLHDIKEQLSCLAIDVALQAMVAVYVYAGLRREEALWLTPGDFEWGWGEHGAILVRAKTIGGETWTPKTGEDRIVPISRRLRGYLDKYRAAAGNSWFFPSPEGGRWDPDNFSQLLRESNAENGLTWSCLDFRHTFGSQLAMKGESLYKISTLMGNSPEICRKHYAALLPESLMGSVDFPSEKSDVCADKPEPEYTPSASQRPKLTLVVNRR
jgi:integrase